MSEYRVEQSGVSKIDGVERTRGKYRARCPECGELTPILIGWDKAAFGTCECCACAFIVREGEAPKEEDPNRPSVEPAFDSTGYDTVGCGNAPE